MLILPNIVDAVGFQLRKILGINYSPVNSSKTISNLPYSVLLEIEAGSGKGVGEGEGVLLAKEV